MRTLKKQNAAHDPQQDAVLQLKRIKKKCTCGVCEPPPPKLPKSMRRLKIQPKYVDRPGSKGSYIPFILLKGEWLRKIGFECQNHVIVLEEPGKLIIRLEEHIQKA